MSLINYIKQSYAELKHVNWPTRKQTIAFTIVVIIFSIITGLFLAFFDKIFSLGIEKIIG